MVDPLTFPVIFSLSAAPAFGRKLAFRATTPPPSKSPETVSTSDASVSSPTSRVPFAATETSCANACWPSPNLIVAPAPMDTSSQPVRVASASVPDRSLNVSVLSLLPPSAVSVPMPLMSAPSKVRLSESPASFTLLIDAPPVTKTFSHPSSPPDMTSACRVPDAPLLNVSVSTPVPPSIPVTDSNDPPANVRASFPAPSVTLPKIAPPLSTVTSVFPADPNIALRVPVPTDAPLPSANVTRLPARSSVLMADQFWPPVTLLDTAMRVGPLPSWSTWIPWDLAPPATAPDAETDTAPAPRAWILMPAPMTDPVTAAAETVTAPPDADTSMPIPLVVVAVTRPVALTVTAPVPPAAALIPAAPPLADPAATLTAPAPLSTSASMPKPPAALPVADPVAVTSIPPEAPAAFS